MENRLHSSPGMTRHEILRNIVGYSTMVSQLNGGQYSSLSFLFDQISTPFGQKCALYADHTATGKPFKMIEDIVQQKIKPMIANSHTETSLMGYFSTQMLHYAEISILKSFSVTKATHFSVPTGNGATGAFERLTKILRVSEISKKVIFTCNKKGDLPNFPRQMCQLIFTLNKSLSSLL